MAPGLQVPADDLDIIRVGRRKKPTPASPNYGDSYTDKLIQYYPTSYLDKDKTDAGLLFARWWYYRKGGCGRFELLLRESNESQWLTSVDNEEEVTIEVKLRTMIDYVVWYRGIVEIVKTREIGAKTYTSVSGMGYIKYLQRAYVSSDFTSTLASSIADTIVSGQVQAESRITSRSVVSGGYTVSAFKPRTTALRAIKTMGEIDDGAIEWGVDELKAFYFKPEDTTGTRVTILRDKHVHALERVTAFERGANKVLVQGQGNSATAEDATVSADDGEKEEVALQASLSATADLTQWGNNYLADSRAAYAESAVVVLKRVPARLCGTHPIGRIRLHDDKADQDKYYQLGKVFYEYGDLPNTLLAAFPELGPVTTTGSTRDRGGLRAKAYLGPWIKSLWEELEVRDAQVDQLKQQTVRGDFVKIAGDTMTGNLTIDKTTPALILDDDTGDDWHVRNSAGTLQFYNATDATSHVVITETGRLGVGTATPSVVMHLIGGAESLIFADGYGVTGAAGPTISTRAARGTEALPTAVLANDVLGAVNFRGYGATSFAAISRAALFAYAEEDYSDVAQGTYLTFETTASGGTTKSAKLRITGAGLVGVGTSGPDRRLDVLDASNPQLRLTQADGTVYSDFQTDINGDLIVLNTGNRVQVGSAATGMLLEVVDASGGNQLELTYALAGGQTTGMRTDTSADFHLDTASTPDAVIVRDDGDLEIGSGDIEASGGYKHAYVFNYPDVTAGLNTYIYLSAAIDVFEYTMNNAGSIIGITMSIDNNPSGASQAITEGSMTATVYKNGVTTGFSLTMSSANDPNASTTQAKDTDTVAAADGLAVVLTATSGAPPVGLLPSGSIDITVCVIVEF